MSRKVEPDGACGHLVQSHELPEHREDGSVRVIVTALIEKVNDSFVRIQHDDARAENVEPDNVA